MKQVLTNIDHYSIKGSNVIFSGESGDMLLSFFQSGIIRITYSFQGIQIPKDMLDASAFICQGENSLLPSEVFVSEGELEFCLQSEDLTVHVQKKDFLVSVFRNGVLIHGGPMGNNDTVIPSYTLRCISDESRITGTWNFPILEDDEFFGLGDKSGVPDHRNRRFKMFNRDSLGYNASCSDPLYKSVPFFLKNNSKTGALCGILFPRTMIDDFDLGQESVFFYSVKVEGGPFSYYLFSGDSYSAILDSLYSVTGRSLFPPLFSFGFFGSSMNYAEPDDASKRITSYFDKVEKEGIPCEGMYLSSGYLKHDGKRYTFLFNKEKFPDPHAFFTSLQNRGYNVTMNIKPGVLVSHPWYDELDRKGYFIKDNEGKTVVEFYWGGQASFVDFNNPDAANWWKEQLKAKFLQNGCTGIWNDNNELELEDFQIPVYRTKQLYPLKMVAVAYKAFKEIHPDARPWNYTRSGYAGIQRYARTWSGDNTSTWETLKYNQYMGISLGLSGLPFFGHDIGGFFGEVPEEELLVRACETAVFQSRFVIHSWRDNGEATEPWTYPHSTQIIENLIKEHYRYLPYIYTCAYQNILTGKPLERSLHLEFPNDSALCSEDMNCMFGDSVMKINICRSGVSSEEIRFPKGAKWIDPYKNAVYEGGTSHLVDVMATGKPHWFAKSGSVIPVSNSLKIKNVNELYDSLCFLVFPGEGKSLFFADDGSTELSFHKFTEVLFTIEKAKLIVEKKLVKFDIHSIEMVVPNGFVFSSSNKRNIRFDSLEDLPDIIEYEGEYES